MIGRFRTLVVTALVLCGTGACAASDQMLALQTFLSDRGCQPGPLDGAVGNATRNAIATFNADTGLALTVDADAATLATIAPDDICIDRFTPVDAFARVARWQASPYLKGFCQPERIEPIIVLGDITQPDGQTGISADDRIGDVAMGAGRAGHACLVGDAKGCEAIVEGLDQYSLTDGFSYSGKRSESSSQFTDTRLEFNDAMIKLAGGYLLARAQNFGKAEQQARIEKWLTDAVDLYDTPGTYFQDNHLTMAANVNALAYRLYGDDKFADRVQKQWRAAFDGMRADGSFPTEAQRGASAINYSNFEFALLMQLAELMLPSGVNLYDTPQVEKLHKAVAFNLDALENWDSILPYAKKNVAPITKNWRVQDFRYDRMWAFSYFIYLERFPHHPNAERIRTLTLDPRTCDQDEPGAPAACGSRDAKVSLMSMLQDDPDAKGGIGWINGYCAYGPLERIEARQLAEIGDADNYAGSYTVRWKIQNVNHPNDPPDTGGNDTLDLAGGTGKFTVPSATFGRKGPPDADRIALSVEYDAEGSIHISGAIDLFQEGRSRQVDFNGKIDDGKLSGTWPDGDVITLELFRKS